MDKKQKIKKKKRSLVTRKGVMLVALLAVSVLLVNIITGTLSWFSPDTETATGLIYQSSGNAIRSQSCTIETHNGTKSSTYANGIYKNQVTYAATTVVSSDYTSKSAGTYYFKTSVINSDPNYASDISLFFANDLPVGTTIAVTYPSNTVRKITANNKSNFHLVRNAYVKRNVSTDVNGPGLLEIEWFVIIPSGTATIPINSLYLMYN